MPSADFCTVIPAPRGAGSPDGQPCRSPRVLRTHFHAYACRIYVMAFCASIGFRRFRTAYPAMPPRIRFLFVRPAICLGLPSDSQSPAKPLPLASTSPCRVCGGLPPLSERALPGAPKKKSPRHGGGLMSCLIQMDAGTSSPPSASYRAGRNSANVIIINTNVASASARASSPPSWAACS